MIEDSEPFARRSIVSKIALFLFLQPQELTFDRIQSFGIAGTRSFDCNVDSFPRRMVVGNQPALHMRDGQGVRVDNPVGRTPDRFVTHIAQAFV
ncbi:hypothetical protein Q0601_17570 [Paracoccus onubensis]|uniref:hypothetical protein n=1 Tax=Paracoccus onubensis TaxID=1675788 RepID=UPI0027302AB4|nr:hypothetical protein [Paracoccus onubensis]MDP0928997.1 hypothetical protein [Paracoccus onubensis]